MRLTPIVLALAGFAAPPALAQPRLDLPLDCTPGDTCYIQNYVDRDAGPGMRDYTCNGLTYDGHKGTDFGLPSLAAMQAGVTVRAAAPGVVKGTRNNMIDKAYTQEEDKRINGRDCGNGVVIDHGDGWETQYCHMRRGSVSVSSGQRVAAGDVLGQVGLSGRTQFPHLHISVRHDGAVIDPFTPTADTATCGTTGEATLWSDDLPYTPGAVLNAGFATKVPEYEDIKAGTADEGPLSTDAPAIVLWGFAFGGREGDVMDLVIDGPGGRFFETSQTVEKDLAQFFRAGGKRLRAPLSSGTYTGTVTLSRDGEQLSSRTTTVLVR